MRMMRMMKIFYRGTGTNCTVDQIVARNDDDDDDHTKEDDKEDDNDMNEPMYYGHDQDKQRHRYDAALVAAQPGSDRTIVMTYVCTTMMETSDGHGDLHQGRLEDDGDGAATVPSATGTLDRKTSQAPPTRTCFQTRELTNAMRSTNNDKACRCHDEDETDRWMIEEDDDSTGPHGSKKDR
jgi:hypothetical protein